MSATTTPARQAIVWAAGENGWTEESHGITRVELKRGGQTIVVRFTVKGAVQMAWNGEEEITGKGKREAVLSLLETPAPEAEVVAPAITVEMPGGDTLEIPPMVLEDDEPEDVTDLEVCDDCAQLIANGGCEGCESCVLTPYFTDHGEPDPEADCQTVNDRFMAKWGDDWAGVVLGEGSRETWGSVDSCDGCGSDVPGTRHAATFVPRFAEDWKRYQDRRKARESLKVRGPWNRSNRRHVA